MINILSQKRVNWKNGRQYIVKNLFESSNDFLTIEKQIIS